MALWGSGYWDQAKWTEIVGQMAATESTTDTFAAEGDVIVAGTMAATESQVDTFSSAGTVQVTGQMAAVESGTDVFAAEGTVQVTGYMAATESQVDTFAAEGDVIVAGTMAATESGIDTFSATGNVEVTGYLAATDPGDTFAAEGDVGVSGYMAAVESGLDVFAATGTVQPAPAPQVIADVGAEKKRIKRRDKELEKFKREQQELREAIERAVTPVTAKAQPVVVSQGTKSVQVLGLDGQRVGINVPPMLDAGVVARLVAEVLEEAKVAAQMVKRRQDAERALLVARAEMARIIKRKRDDEFLLLID